jgi:hypothetical protein
VRSQIYISSVVVFVLTVSTNVDLAHCHGEIPWCAGAWVCLPVEYLPPGRPIVSLLSQSSWKDNKTTLSHSTDSPWYGIPLHSNFCRPWHSYIWYNLSLHLSTCSKSLLLLSTYHAIPAKSHQNSSEQLTVSQAVLSNTIGYYSARPFPAPKGAYVQWPIM